MRKSLVVLALFATILIVCSTSFAATYVVTNDDNCTATSNTSSIYTLNTTNGSLTLFKTLSTGGIGGCGGFFSAVNNAVTQNHKCLFVYDGGNGAGTDIAAFAVPSLKKVGNFSNAAVQGPFPGGSIALSPDGKWLYATYAGTLNVGAWAVGSNCALTFINAYTASAGADTYAGIAVTPNGANLLVGVIDFGAIEEFSINGTNGTLTDNGSVSVAGFSACAANGCFPEGIDITKNSKVAVIGNASVTEPIIFSVNISPTGLSGARLWNLTNTPNVENLDVPFLSAAAFSTGTGDLYISGSGFAGGVPGVVTANFGPTGITVKNATQIASAGSCGCDGVLQSTHNLMVVSEWFNTLQTFKINSNGSITPTPQGPVNDANANGALSFFIFPQTR